MNQPRPFNFFSPWPPVETHGWEEGVKRLGMNAPLVQRYGTPGVTTKHAQQLRWRRTIRKADLV